MNVLNKQYILFLITYKININRHFIAIFIVVASCCCKNSTAKSCSIMIRRHSSSALPICSTSIALDYSSDSQTMLK